MPEITMAEAIKRNHEIYERLKTEIDQGLEQNREWALNNSPLRDERVTEAIKLILQYGDVDGGHHKQWLLDQVLQVLAGDAYPTLVDLNWDQGIAP